MHPIPTLPPRGPRPVSRSLSRVSGCCWSSLSSSQPARWTLTALLAVLLWALAGQAAAAGLEAKVDRTRLVEGESLLLTLSGPGDVWGTPDTDPLAPDFEVKNQGQGTSTIMTNGQVTTTRDWRFLLSPRSPGRLTIPALKLNNLESMPIAIEVVPASQAAQIGEAPAARLEAELDPAAVYVQGQAIYTLRILLRPQVQNASLEDPKAEGVLFERLGEDRVHETQRDGLRYHVIERRYALLPQRSGPIEIQAPVLSAAVPEPRSSRGQSSSSPFGSPFGPGDSPFERFFGRDPFAEMDGLIQRARPIQARGPALTLNVKPQPDGTSSPWLPAESLQLADTWTPDPSQARVGDPITRTIAITAQGLNAAQLPDLTIAVPDGVKLYPDKPRTETRAEGDTLVAVKEIKLALVPSVAGQLTLPEVRLAWWDTQKDKEQVALLPERTLVVMPASGEADARPKASQPATVSPPASPHAPAPSPSAPLSEASQTEVVPAIHQAATAWPLPAGYWPWLGAGLGLSWLITLLLWWRERRRHRQTAPAKDKPDAGPRPNPGAALQRARQACSANDARGAREALLAWGKACWPGDPPARLESLAQRLDGEAANALRRLDRHLYAAGDNPWDGPGAWRDLESALAAAARAAGPGKAAPDPLPPLYPG